MSCGEPIDYSKPWFAPAGFNKGVVSDAIYSPKDPIGTGYFFGDKPYKVLPTEELVPTNELLTIASVQERAEVSKAIEWANTPLDELPKLSDLEYFQRNLWKGLGIPESYLINGVAPSRKADLVTKAYVDNQVTVIDTVDDLVDMFGNPGDIYLDTVSGDKLDEMSKLFSYDGDKWVTPVAEFNFFDVSLVREPLLDDCRLPESNEDKYNRAMGGVEQ